MLSQTIRVLVLASLLSLTATAQERQPFSSIEIVAAGVVTGADEPLNTYWAPQPGASLRIQTPFYLGDVFASVHVAMVSARDAADVPSYRAMLVSGGWGMPLDLQAGLRFTPSIRAGLYRMRFDDPGVTATVANESELAAGIDLRLSLPVHGEWALSGSASAVRVLTRQPIDLRMVEVGLGRRINSPAWLRQVLE